MCSSSFRHHHDHFNLHNHHHLAEAEVRPVSKPTIQEHLWRTTFCILIRWSFSDLAVSLLEMWWEQMGNTVEHQIVIQVLVVLIINHFHVFSWSSLASLSLASSLASSLMTSSLWLIGPIITTELDRYLIPWRRDLVQGGGEGDDSSLRSKPEQTLFFLFCTYFFSWKTSFVVTIMFIDISSLPSSSQKWWSQLNNHLLISSCSSKRWILSLPIVAEIASKGRNRRPGISRSCRQTQPFPRRRWWGGSASPWW